ncbi:DNA primase [Nitrospirillum pindoramense]|uniref:DNA primase n=1 Tax=Nitrospirillum amazonense TaxID=28077 RepID=A0A560HFS5_9PROT|nr:DNA primase [Nitrospirillum amazonense]TWB45287.1 DNA primase [Nitrospirillum amazonense]
MALPPQFLEELRNRLTLSDVVMRRVRLQRAGREFRAPCPFHNEKTPSFYVNDQKGFFHCFGCGAHGDVIGFVMRNDNLSFMEAVEALAPEAGLTVPKASPQERERFEREKSLYDLVERATRWFEGQLRAPVGRHGLAYLRGRGLDDEAMARFRLGYAPSDGAGLRAELVTAGYTEADMVEAGLFKRPDDGRAPFPFFRNRVLFPVTDRRGRVVAFGGRILEGEGPKYINSAENPLFHKGDILYGMSRARQAAADGKPVIVTEGYMDVIASVMAGFEGAVAPLGTALTETQIQALWKLAPEGQRMPILCFDGDNAGRRAAFRAVERVLPLLMPDHSVRVAFMPEKEDPDSLIRAGGAAAFQAVLDRARPLTDVLWDMEAAERDLAQPDAQAGMQAALEAQLERIPDARVRNAYHRAFKDRLYQLGRPARPAFQPGAGAGFTRGQRPGAPPFPVARQWDKRFRARVEIGSARWRERLLLAVVLNHPVLFETLGETLAMISFATEGLERLRQALVECLSHDSGLDAAGLRRHLSACGFADELDETLGADLPSYARPEATPESARAGWQEVWLNSQELVFQTELREAERRLAEDPSEETLARLMALKREELIRRGHALDPEGEGV